MTPTAKLEMQVAEESDGSAVAQLPAEDENPQATRDSDTEDDGDNASDEPSSLDNDDDGGVSDDDDDDDDTGLSLQFKTHSSRFRLDI